MVDFNHYLEPSPGIHRSGLAKFTENSLSKERPAGFRLVTGDESKDFAPHRIRVNAIAPDFLLAKRNRALLGDEKADQYTDRGKTVIGRTPLGRFGYLRPPPQS